MTSSITALRGSIVAIVTPMQSDGGIDETAFCNLLEWHIASGTQAVVVAGTTGESPTLSMAENRRLIALAVECSGGRIPIIGGVGANSTAEAIELTRNAAADGADAGLSVVPYYNRPMQEGMFLHFSAIADCSDLPIILYDVPKRCSAELEPETVWKLSEHKNIIGIKDATADMERLHYFRENFPDFLLYSGDDGSAAVFMLGGGQGVISVTANVAPRTMQAMCKAAQSGDADVVEEWEKKLRPFHAAQSAESNPIPVKWALEQMGKISSGIRLPLTPLSAQSHQTVANAVAHIDAVSDLTKE